jgi:ATP-dependent DNA helicase RecQ
VVDVLLGSVNEKIENNAHQILSVYSIGKDKSRHYWLTLGDRLLELKALKQGDFRVLMLDEYGMEIIKKSLTVTIREERLAEQKRYTKTATYTSDEHNPIFEQLRGLRSSIAKNNGVPPYVVFSDKTLQEMAQKLPQNKTQMLQVGGVGDVKFERYGEEFLALCGSIKEQAL